MYMYGTQMNWEGSHESSSHSPMLQVMSNASPAPIPCLHHEWVV